MGTAPAVPVISEFMAFNSFTLADEDGAFSDWIEIYNPDTTPVSLSGWRLTDTSSNLSKWVFPAVTVQPGEFLVVFASGKNRAIAGSQLHTNFVLNEAGGYLTLVSPGGTKSTEFNPFPAQPPDNSFGLPFTGTTFVAGDATGDYLVPPDGSLGNTWTAAAFTPTGWSSGPTGFGFGMLVPGITVQECRGPAGTVDTLAETDLLLSGGGGATETNFQIRPFINFLPADQQGSDGRYGVTNVVFAVPGEDHVARGTGYVVITTPGTYTFGNNTDDGSLIRIDLNGDGDFVDPGEDVMTDPTLHGPQDHVGTVTFPAPGNYLFQTEFFERGGGDEFEFYSTTVPATFTGWDPSMRLVGDLANGGLAVLTLPSGVPGAGAGSYTGTDVGPQMLNISPTLYARMPFNFAPGTPLTTLSLKMRYNDGFVAFLNGTEIARANATGSLNFQSVADSERLISTSLLQVPFNVSALRASMLNGNNVLAIQGVNSSSSNSSFLVQSEFSGTGITQPVVQSYFEFSTAGASNTTQASSGFVLPVVASIERGVFSAPITTNLTSATPGATMYYTTNGTVPTTTNGTEVPPASPTDPGLATLNISQTTVVRVIAVKAGLVSTRPVTHTYVFPADIITQPATLPGWPAPGVGLSGQLLDYAMDPIIVTNANPSIGGQAETKDSLASIPSVCLTIPVPSLTDPTTGIYTHANQSGPDWERAASMEMINDPASVSHNFHVPCGATIRGGYGLAGTNPKHGFRVYFRDKYGAAKLTYPVFAGDDSAAPNFAELDLTCAQNFSWSSANSTTNTFLRDQVCSDMQQDMGQPAQRNRYVHLYLNGVYWGVYAVQERPETAFAASYKGGAATDYDVIKTEGAPYTTTAAAGNLTAWESLRVQARTAYRYSKDLKADGTVQNPAYTTAEKNAEYFKLIGRAANGLTPTADPVLLDEKNLIDYMILTFFSGNEDGPLSSLQTPANSVPNSHFALRNRTGGAGFIFVAHDGEDTFDTGVTDRTGPFGTYNLAPWSTASVYNAQFLHQDLSPSKEYQLKFADRVYKHLVDPNGVLSVAANQARINQLAATLEPAMIAESARWGDAKGTVRTADDWRGAKTVLLNYFASRNDAVIAQLRADSLYTPATLNPPVLNPLSGPLPENTPVAMSNPGVSAIWFTVDGGDPRDPGTVAFPLGSVSSGATARTIIANSINPGTGGTVWKFLDNGTNQGTAWKETAFDDSVWTKSGVTPIGHGNGMPSGFYKTTSSNTDVDPGTAGIQKPITTYFRTKVNIPNPSQVFGVSLEVMREDGCVVYLNGTEIGRLNMPAGAIGHTTVASSDISLATDVQTWQTVPITPGDLVTGDNVFAVETHLRANNSARLTFNARLRIQQPSANVPAGFTAGTHVVRARSIDAAGNWSPLTEQTYTVGGVTPYTTWKTANGVTDSNADPDKDGVPNFLEYATGGNPNAPDASPNVTPNTETFILSPPQVSGEYFTVSFRKSLAATDVNWTVEVSTALTPGTWSTTPATFVRQVSNGDGTATVTYRLTTRLPNSGEIYFGRARATLQ